MALLRIFGWHESRKYFASKGPSLVKTFGKREGGGDPEIFDIFYAVSLRPLTTKLANALIFLGRSKTIKILSEPTMSKLRRKFWGRLDGGLHSPPPEIFLAF